MNDLTEEEKDLIRRLREWNEVKINLNLHAGRQDIREGEIYWAGVGQNIGEEMYGKGDSYTRPVLVFKKLSRFRFMGVPLTSQEHEGSWYVPFMHDDKKQVAVIGQARVMSTKRLFKMIGEIDDTDMKRIEEGFKDLYIKNIP